MHLIIFSDSKFNCSIISDKCQLNAYHMSKSLRTVAALSRVTEWFLNHCQCGKVDSRPIKKTVQEITISLHVEMGQTVLHNSKL